MEERFGFAEPTPEEGDASLGGFMKFFGRRALGFASDLGNAVTFGQADRLYRDNQEQGPTRAISPRRGAIPPTAAQPETPEQVPVTPDEAIAQSAIAEGTRMAEEATAASAPPGAIDFSQVDFDAADIPSMPVRDWVDYRAREVRNLMAQGMNAQEAHASVTQLQQQGFVDYAQQSLMHLQRGDSRAAAAALRAAYQYFPNGSDVRLGASQGQDGQPVIVGMGFDEETGEPKGNPMLINPERLSVMIENFSNPDAFRTWTKDWRDEQFQRQKYEEVEKPEAESNALYRERMGQAALAGAEADLVRAANAGGDENSTTLQQARQVFQDRLEMTGLTEPALADVEDDTRAQG